MNFRSISFIIIGFLFLLLQGFLFNEDDFLLFVFGLFFCFTYFILLLVTIGIDLYRLIANKDIIPFKPTIIGIVVIFMNIGFGQYLSAIYLGEGPAKEFYFDDGDKLSLYKNGKFSYYEGNMFGSSTSYGHYAIEDEVIYFDRPINVDGVNSYVGKIESSSKIQFYKGKVLLLCNKIPL